MPPNYVFNLGQAVLIKAPDIIGTVQAILFNMDGVQMQVAYWDGSIRRVEWMFHYEIEALAKTKSTQP